MSRQCDRAVSGVPLSADQQTPHGDAGRRGGRLLGGQAAGRADCRPGRPPRRGQPSRASSTDTDSASPTVSANASPATSDRPRPHPNHGYIQ